MRSEHHWVVSLRLDPTLAPVQITSEHYVDDELVTYLTYDAGPFETSQEALQSALAELPAEQRLW